VTKIDRRSRLGRLLLSLASDLSDHVGGYPNAVQNEIIDQICRIRARIYAADQQRAAGKRSISNADYLALSDQLTALLLALGPKQSGHPDAMMAAIGAEWPARNHQRPSPEAAALFLE